MRPGTSVGARPTRYSEFDQVNRAYLSWQVEQFEPYLGRRVLEIGCGVGGILDVIGPRDLVVGMDVEEPVLDLARRKLAGRDDLTLMHADLLGLDLAGMAALRANRFDTVVCINVLEHIEDDAEAVARMAGLLEAGGHLCVLVPAHPRLYGSYDALDGHHRRYTRRALVEVLADKGLELLFSRRFNFVGAAGWWAQYRLLRRQIHGPSHLGVMNAIIPAARRLERVVEPPVGLSLVAVCRKS